MNIILDLKKGSCIKRSAKKKYETVLNDYFSKTVSKDKKALMEKEIEALKFFLENADFSGIRSAYKELSGVKNIRVALLFDKEDYKIVLNDKIIKSYWKQPLLKINRKEND
ncbi:MAG: hypothetical protein JRJ49_01710 [Deltaproteobacteria bacterium]|nr:hypothetical protein [Deltaproteobacteria bacterium]